MNFKKTTIFAQTLAILFSLVNINTCAYDSLNTESSTENTLQITAKTEQQGNESNKPKVSVVVPVYNGEKYIKQCAESLINQTEKNIEIIFVNDGSKDNSLNMLLDISENRKEKEPITEKESVTEQKPIIKVIDQKNTGEAGARQRGLDEATGEFVTFVDQDDYVDKDAYETAYKSAIENDADIVVYGWRNFTDEGNKIIRNDCEFDKKIVFEDWFKAKTERASIYVWNKLYKRSLITDNNIRFDTELKVCGDECFNICVYPYAKKIVHIPYTFYNYRMNNNSSLFNFSFKKVITNYKKMWKYANSFFKERNIEFTFYERFTYFKIYKDEFVPIIKTWLGFSK